MVSGRGYVFVALGVFVVVLGLSYFAGPQIVSFINQTMNGASSMIGSMATLVGEPLKWVFSNPLVGSIVIAMFWPIGAILLGLFLVMMLIAIGGGTVLDLGNQAGAVLR